LTEHFVQLRDGRRLCFAEYGDPDGFAVISAHGGLACRFDVAAADDLAREAGIRLISPDRPGVGLSDPLPGRTMLDWAADVLDLSDRLGLERFSVMGWSMGGPYAAAVAYAMPSRVSRVAILAGALPLDEAGNFEQLPRIDRIYTQLSQRAPCMARQCFRIVRWAAGVAPTVYGRLAASELGPADGAVIRGEGYDTFTRMSREALRQPSGAVEEYRAWARPWGFAPEDVGVAVDVWAGTDDELIDPRWPRELADRIPNATLHVCSGGHFMAHRHYCEIFAALRVT
jgi:pimeloyl-ACP methyl ester carboxylesterase